jgi:hypothetical protein
MANILNALNKTSNLSAQIGSIQQAGTGKATTDAAAPGKSTLGAQAVEEQGSSALQAMAGEQQVSSLQQAKQWGGIEADAAERKAAFEQKKAAADQETEYKMSSMIRRYSENWSALSEDRRGSLMQAVLTLDNVRNEEKAQKLQIESQKRNLDDANNFAAAQATAKYADFIDIAKTNAVIRNYIYKGDLQAKEELTRISGADSFSIAMSGLESARIQSTYNDMARGVEKNLPKAIDYALKEPKKETTSTAAPTTTTTSPFTTSEEVDSQEI